MKMSKLRPTFSFVKRLEFLSNGKLYLKDSVKTITLSYETRGTPSNGLRQFISQKLPTIQFKNPDVQVVLFKNDVKFPNINIYYSELSEKSNLKIPLQWSQLSHFVANDESHVSVRTFPPSHDDRKVMLDVEGKTAERIYSELSAVAGKTDAQIQRALKKAEYNPANFGDRRKGRFCICEVPGQVPCPSKVPLGNVKHSWHDKKETS